MNTETWRKRNRVWWVYSDSVVHIQNKRIADRRPTTTKKKLGATPAAALHVEEPVQRLPNPKRSRFPGHPGWFLASMLQEDVAVTRSLAVEQIDVVLKESVPNPKTAGTKLQSDLNDEQVTSLVSRPLQDCFNTMVAAELTVTPIAIIIKILQNIFRWERAEASLFFAGNVEETKEIRNRPPGTTL